MNHVIAYWCVSAVLFVWGLAYFGLVVFSFFISTPEHWATLVAQGRIKAEYAQYIANIPSWVIATTVVAALTRLGGGTALLFRHDIAFTLYTISLALIVVLMFRGFVLADVTSVIRTSQVVLEYVFLGLSVFAVWFAHTTTIGPPGR